MHTPIHVPKWFMATMVFSVLVSFTAGAAVLVPSKTEVPPLDPTLIQQADMLSLAFQQAADHISPSVVSIMSEKQLQTLQGRGSLQSQIPEEFRRFFGDDFDRFFQTPMQPRGGGVQQGFGSGVIVSNDGYILTNNHVVADADKITVKTVDEDTYEAEIVGRDPKSDIALLKVDASGLPAAKLAAADDVRVGQWVIAVGGPFGLENTVTSGIVSATGRNTVGIADYENFIQTDAAINPGNSGGPLVNLHGEVVGINTAIATRSGSNAGVGFSIPIGMARHIMGSLKETGRVDRGFIGAVIQNLTKDLAASFNYDSDYGVLIGDVTDDGPAAKAGLKSGDIVRKIDGKKMKNSSELRNAVATTKPDSTVEFEIFRDGKIQIVEVRIGLLDDKVMVASNGDTSVSTDLGMTVQTVTPRIAEALGYSESQKGVVITEVEPGSLAASAGLRKKDIIVKLNGEDIEDTGGFREVLNKYDAKQGLRFQVKTEGISRFLFLKTR